MIDIFDIAKPEDVIPFFGLSEISPNSGRIFTNANLETLIENEVVKIQSHLIDLNYTTIFEENSDLYNLIKFLCVEGVAVDIWKTIGFSLVNRWMVTYKTFSDLHSLASSLFYGDVFHKSFFSEKNLVRFADASEVVLGYHGYGENSDSPSPSLNEINKFIDYSSALAIACCKANNYEYEGIPESDIKYKILNNFVVGYSKSLFARARSYSTYDPQDSGLVMGESATVFELEIRNQLAILSDPSPIGSFLPRNAL